MSGARILRIFVLIRWIPPHYEYDVFKRMFIAGVFYLELEYFVFDWGKNNIKPFMNIIPFCRRQIFIRQ